MEANLSRSLPVIKALVQRSNRSISQESAKSSSIHLSAKKAHVQFQKPLFFLKTRTSSHSSFRVASLFSGMQKRTFSSQIRAPLQGKEFFNRNREISALTKLLESKPQISLVSGPVNSGKTSLMLKILEDISKKNNRPVLHLDLRARGFHTVEGFSSSLEEGMTSWANRIFKAIPKQLTAEYEGLKLEASNPSLATQPIDKLNRLFDSLSKNLPSHNVWSGAQVPILFIDEANEMRTLLKDDQGHQALQDMFKWFVMNTKQNHRFHVILGSSDSFFHLWVEKFVGASRFQSYVIGDLPKAEAERFWQERIIKQLEWRREDLPPPDFQDAYGVCGGNMFFLENYHSEYIEMRGEMAPENFSFIGAEKTQLRNALSRSADEKSNLLTALYSNLMDRIYETNGKSISHPDRLDSIWTQVQLVTVMKKLTGSKSGFLIYDDLCKEIGKEVIDAMIDHNLLHLRPTKRFSYDLPDSPYDEPIVTAETPASLVAMRHILKNLDA